MKLKKQILKIFLIFSIFIIFFYTYYFLPSQNKGSIKLQNIDNSQIENNDALKAVEELKFKNTFKNTEYINQDKAGKKYVTKAEESFILQNEPDIIYLKNVESYTKIKKDNSILSIKSKKAVFDQKNNETIYEKNVVITNKSYLITSNLARHEAQKNLITILGDVVMKDLTNGLSHEVYCDIVEIDTISNNAVAYMKNENSKVLSKKYK